MNRSDIIGHTIIGGIKDIFVAISPEELKSSTKIIVKSLEAHNPLKNSMRGGVLRLSDLLLADMPGWLALDNDERGVAQIDNVDELTEGWEHIAKHLDYSGRTYVDGSGPIEAARMHYKLAQVHALEMHLTGERNEKDISYLAYMLGQHVLSITTPII